LLQILSSHIAHGPRKNINCMRGRRGSDHIVVEFTTTYAISAYHHLGEVYSIQHCDKVWQ
jgi:hypothetical protein